MKEALIVVMTLLFIQAGRVIAWIGKSIVFLFLVVLGFLGILYAMLRASL